MLDGDSEMGNLAIPSLTLFLANTNAGSYNNAVGNTTCEERTIAALVDVDPFYSGVGRDLLVVWCGTNAFVNAVATYVPEEESLATYCQQRRKAGWKVIVGTMLDRTGTGADSWKNSYNVLIRSHWRAYADGLLDFASNPQVGADGAGASTTYFSDGLHTTTAAKDNILDWQLQRAANRFWGNTDFSTANVYTTGAAAATAITAASTNSGTGISTITTTLNPPQGACVFITGVTSSTGTYNSGAANSNPPCWMVLTTSGTNFTFQNTVATTSAGTAFGTVSVPLQQDVDNYAVLAGSASSPSFTLQTCQGRTGHVDYFMNQNTTSPWVLTPTNSETIDGAASLTMGTASSGNYPVVGLQSQLVSASAAGCNWVRVQ
jgi:hypothetical protein